MAATIALSALEQHQATQSHNPHHRKIELQSSLDLQYLRQNLERAAQQKLDLHFPVIPSHDQNGSNAGAKDESTHSHPETLDPMRASVSSLVSGFIAQTFASASHSISVNGLDATTLSPHSSLPGKEEKVEFEAYDQRLTAKLSSLYSDLESLTAQVAGLRKEAPGRSAAAYSERLKETIEQEDDAFRTSLNNTHESPNEAAEHGLKLNVPSGNRTADSWQEDVEEMYERGTSGLMALGGMGALGNPASTGQKGGRGVADRSLTGTVGLLERAGSVAREME